MGLQLRSPPLQARPQRLSPRLQFEANLQTNSKDSEQERLENVRQSIVTIERELVGQLNQVIEQLDDRIQVLKRQIELPTSRCDYCNRKIVWRSVEEYRKAFNPDGTKHLCLKERTRHSTNKGLIPT